jgi:excisionase family DNA binding protein
VDEVITVKQAAARLKTTPKTVRGMIRRGDLPAAKVGKGYRIAARVLDELLTGLPVSAPVPEAMLTRKAESAPSPAERAWAAARERALSAPAFVGKAQVEPEPVPAVDPWATVFASITDPIDQAGA